MYWLICYLTIDVQIINYTYYVNIFTIYKGLSYLEIINIFVEKTFENELSRFLVVDCSTLACHTESGSMLKW